MQDKEKNMEITDRFRDRSWNEMRRKLDQEMPHKVVEDNGKKRYLLLAAILLIGFVSGTATMFYYFQQFDTELELTNDLALTTPAVETPQVEQTTTTEAAAVLQPESPVIATENSNAKKSASTKVNNTHFQQIKTPEKSEATFTHKDQNVLNENAFKPDQVDRVSQIKEPVLSTDLPAALPPIEALQDMATLPIEAIEQPFAEKLPSLKVPKENKWSYGIFTGAYANPSPAFAGLAFGTRVGYNLNRRLIVSHGLQYSILDGFKNSRAADESFGWQNSSSSANAIITTQFENSFEVYYDVQPSPDQLPVSKLHYIEMPVEIAYRLSGKFQIGLGAKAGYLIGVKAVDRFESLFNVTADRFAANAESNNSNHLYSSLKKIDFATSAALTYFPFKKLGISLQYSHGWLDFTKDEVWTRSYNHFNRNFLFSTVYLF